MSLAFGGCEYVRGDCPSASVGRSNLRRPKNLDRRPLLLRSMVVLAFAGETRSCIDPKRRARAPGAKGGGGGDIVASPLSRRSRVLGEFYAHGGDDWIGRRREGDSGLCGSRGSSRAAGAAAVPSATGGGVAGGGIVAVVAG